MNPDWLVRLDHRYSSYSVLAALLVLALAAGLLYQSGILGWVLSRVGQATRWGIRFGFHFWERWFSWANCPVYCVIVVSLLGIGRTVVADRPMIALGCAAVVLAMGLATCLAYMFLDIERYEVERGRKAVHNPTKGQELAPNVARYGHRVGLPLLAAAAAGVIGGFALLNQSLYESVGQRWYAVGEEGPPTFADFLTYALINVLSLVDILDLADSRRLIHVTFVRKAAWPAAVLLAAFRSFFTLILLQQVFASVRQGKLLAETIADFWSPHEPIHDRARNSLPQFGVAVIRPLLVSLREMTSLTKEQRDQLPPVLAVIGPSSISTLIGHLQDSHEHVRAVAAGTLGHLGAQEATAEIAALVDDPSDLVRLSAVSALGSIAAVAGRADRSRHVRIRRGGRGPWRWFSSRGEISQVDATSMAVGALLRALGDKMAAVRGQAAASLGRAKSAVVGTAEKLAALLHDPDETVRCQAAEALGQIGCGADALLLSLDDHSAEVRTAAARGLKSLGRGAATAVPKLVELLQDRDETVRLAAAEAVAAAGSLNGDSTVKLAAGLSSEDNVVRAQTAEALGNVGAPAEHAAPPLVEALQDGNDVVRAKAVEALGKLGGTAAPVAVPGLVRALQDPDSWVSALAAEALGEMGGAGEDVVPALVHATKHVNPQVRANAVGTLGKLASPASWVREAVEGVATDEDAGVRAEAVRALGRLGLPPESSRKLVREALADPEPQVRAAAVEAVGLWELPGEEIDDLLPLLQDANDQVKLQVAEVLPRLMGATDSVIQGLCRVVSEDDSATVQACAALALARLGAPAAAAGPLLLRAARTAEVGVREQAMRALVMIQPPEAIEAFTAGLTDPSSEVRVVASAGWIKAATVPENVAATLVETLRDPETQVRANIAYALSRLNALPREAVPLLRECAADPNDGLRLNAAAALQLAPAAETAELMDHLLDDPNVRVRLVAARAVLGRNPGDPRAVAVVRAAANDPAPRVRQGAEELAPLLIAPVPEPSVTMAAVPASEVFVNHDPIVAQADVN